MTIKTRRSKIKQAAKQVTLCTDNLKLGNIYAQRSLSDPAKNYQQRIKWIGKGQIEDVQYLKVMCSCNRSTHTYDICKGNSNGHNCYHTLATLTFAAKKNDKVLVLFDTFTQAVGYANMGGQIIKVVSSQGRGQSWGVIK